MKIQHKLKHFKSIMCKYYSINNSGIVCSFFNKSKPCLTSYTEIKLRQIELSIFFKKMKRKRKREERNGRNHK